MGNESQLLIGAVAKRAGVSVDTVRFYERRGLLRALRRRDTRYREFSSSAVERILFAKRLQALGFRLAEVACWRALKFVQKEVLVRDEY